MSVTHDSRLHTVEIQNHTEQQIDCFFFSQYIPNDNQVTTSNIRINNQFTTDFLLEIEEKPDIVYPGTTTHRWVFGIPHYGEPDHCAGLQLRSGQTAVITYMTEQPMLDVLHSFVGWLPERKEGFFGYN